ncbi:hypothetical protein B0H15DRAFT_803831 [Mycena belliarum]|uniref:Myb/SANT-like domain-containing protein n=1 Tax=Mycena belliarum TaxID=1033014 RepID=A0AAD6TYN5_9AGAR|nr:hypothetical protein B0H15DRAFT_803831 [Mycena belliae]
MAAHISAGCTPSTIVSPMALTSEDTVSGTAGADAGPTSAKWTDTEVRAMLTELEAKKHTHMSGNGFKPQVWATVVIKVNEASPEGTQKKDKGKCMNKLSYLKKIFDLYLYVQKTSGEGWDDEKKQATNTEEGITNFVKTYGDQYARCYKSSCPYYMELDTLYRGLINKATGDNVLHLQKRKKKRQAAPSSHSSNTLRAPLEPLILANNPTNVPIDIQDSSAPTEDGTYNDETDVTVASKKRERAPTDDESENDSITRPSIKRQRSESGGSARRNAEAGTQISRALDKLSTAMAQPLVTSDDLSHVTKIVEILKDKTLLPDDPRGRLYRTVSTALSRDAALAQLFILEEDRTRRIGLLEGILDDAGLL